ncbi:MAG: fasciclin domain-containing protein [Ferruginibacter sp.]
MNKHLQRFLLLLTITVCLVNCRKKAYDDYYGRPDTLEPPIYQQLVAKGNFKNLLGCIDKAGYKNILDAAGYWTLFAPHDSAFQVYFKEKNIAGVDQLDSVACQKIVTYCLVYNAFKKERIGDFQSNIGWVPNAAFKRRTANYQGVYDGKDTAGNSIKIISSNRNNNGSSFYVEADNNNKYIPYFVDNFMAAKGLTAADYNYFYPNTPYTGFNVIDAIVTEKDIAAENGVIHVINKVLTVLPGIDEYLASNPDYSEFKKLFDKYLIQYALNPVVTQNYHNVKGGSEQIYTKIFNSALAFSPNNENFLKQQDNDGQANSYSIFVPTNAVLLDYVNTVLLEKYTSLDAIPIGIIYDFVNAHLWQTAVWPSKFKTSFNYVGEEARFDPATNITDRQILSNGIFYGTNKVQDANVFASVYGKAYLDPDYTMMTSLLNQELKFQIANIYQKYTLLLVSNSVLNAAGYFADPTVDNNPNYQWRYTPPLGGTSLTGSSALVRLLRVLNLHVLPDLDVTDLSAPGLAMTYGGEFVKYNNKELVAAGNVDDSTVANSFLTKSAKNGHVHYLDHILTYSEKTIGKHIEALGSPATSEFNSFWQYLKNATSIYNASTGDIVSVASGTFYTFFIPDNAAILQAVNDGLLPGTGVAPNMVPLFKPTSAADKDLVTKFIYYHILNKRSIATDGKESGSFETLFKNANGDATSVFVNNTVPGYITLTDMNTRNASVRVPESNFLSNRCVIHLINNYLKYTD